MPLWTPKDASRPLWAQRRFPSSEVGDRFLLSPIALDHRKVREAGGRQASSVEGGPQRGRRLPGGGVPLDDGSGKGGELGFTRRGGCKYRPILRPQSPPAGGVDPPAPTEVGCGAGAWNHGVGQRQALPRAPPLAPHPGFPWRPLHYNKRERAYDGPTPFQILDFAHVALSAATEGGWSSDPASLIDVVPGGGTGQQRDSFPYLQLHPPHCDSCTC